MPIQTPICDLGQKAYDFKLKSTDNEIILLSVDLSLKSWAFWPKSHIGVCIGIM